MTIKPSDKGPRTRTSRDRSTPVNQLGYSPMMTGYLTRAGYTTWGDLLQADYKDLLAIKGFGVDSMLLLMSQVKADGHHLKNTPSVVDADLLAQVRRDKDEALGRRTHTSSTVRARRQGKMSASPVEEQAYVEIIVQRGYRCRSCQTLTVVTEGENPKGMEFKGFSWTDSVGQASIEPYFVCITCAGNVELMGKLVITLMENS